MARNAYYKTKHWLALKRATHERDGWRCIVNGCTTPTFRLTCDHIKTRPNVDHPTQFDVLSNTRSLCGHHDAQIKERSNGERSRAGKPVVKGCDAGGWPIDPSHHWSR